MIKVLILGIFFFVETALGYAQEFRDVRPPVEYPSSNWAIVVLLSALVVACVVLGNWLRIRFIKKRIPIVSCAQQALTQMQKLEHSHLARAGEYITFYVRLSEIIRQYIENQFSIKASEMTTEEFLQHPQTTQQLSEHQKKILKAFMQSSDMIKFAKASPQAQQMADDYECLVQFIKETESHETRSPAAKKNPQN